MFDVFFITRFFFRPSGSREGYKRSRFSQCWYWIFRFVILKKLFNFVGAKAPDFMVKITLKNSCFYIYPLLSPPQACLINAIFRSSQVNYVLCTFEKILFKFHVFLNLILLGLHASNSFHISPLDTPEERYHKLRKVWFYLKLKCQMWIEM